MFRISYVIGIFCMAVPLVACDPKTEPSTINTEVVDTTAIIKEQPDTLLQAIENVTLKAVGNSVEEMTFDKDTIEVKAGALVKLTLINEGTDQSMIHNVVFTQPDKYKLVALAGAKVGAPGNYVPVSEAIVASSPLALPGQTVELEFTAPLEPGTYNYVCTYPDHWQKMNGVLIVK